MRNLRYCVFAATLAAIAFVGPASAQPYGPGYGMMGGWGGGYGPGGMMGGYGPGYGMMNGWGGGYGHPGWMMQGWGGGYGMGPGMMYGWGYGNEGNLNLTVDQVKSYLQQMIRNPNLKIGDVKEKDADTIVAEVVTKQGGSLVQKLDFNRHNGSLQPEQ